MSFGRIVLTAVAAAVVPLVVGLAVTLLTLGSGEFETVRRAAITVLLVLLFLGFGRRQREGVVAHAAAAVAIGWILSEALRAASLWLFAEFATRGSTPDVPSWSPSLSYLGYLVTTAAIGIVLSRARPRADDRQR